MPVDLTIMPTEAYTNTPVTSNSTIKTRFYMYATAVITGPVAFSSEQQNIAKVIVAEYLSVSTLNITVWAHTQAPISTVYFDITTETLAEKSTTEPLSSYLTGEKFRAALKSQTKVVFFWQFVVMVRVRVR